MLAYTSRSHTHGERLSLTRWYGRRCAGGGPDRTTQTRPRTATWNRARCAGKTWFRTEFRRQITPISDADFCSRSEVCDFRPYRVEFVPHSENDSWSRCRMPDSRASRRRPRRWVRAKRDRPRFLPRLARADLNTVFTSLTSRRRSRRILVICSRGPSLLLF